MLRYASLHIDVNELDCVILAFRLSQLIESSRALLPPLHLLTSSALCALAPLHSAAKQWNLVALCDL